MGDERIDNLLDALFAPAPAAKASERALQALEQDLGVVGGGQRPARAPRPAEPLLGATALDPMPAVGPAIPDRRAPLTGDRLDHRVSPLAREAEVGRPGADRAGLRGPPPEARANPDAPGRSRAPATPAAGLPARPRAPATPAAGLPLMPMLAPPAPPPGMPPRVTGSMPRFTGEGSVPPGSQPARVTGSMPRFTGDAAGHAGHEPPPRSTGSMPRFTGEVTGHSTHTPPPRVTGSMPRFTGEVVEPPADMPPLGEAPRFAPGPPMPTVPRGATGSMPVLSHGAGRESDDFGRRSTGAMPVVRDSSRGHTGSMPNILASRSTGSLPSVDFGPRAIAVPDADDFLGDGDDPFASAEALFHEIDGLSFDEPAAHAAADPGGGQIGAVVSDPAEVIGSMRRVVQLKVGLNDVPWASLDPRAGFVLTQVDGNTSYEELVLISGMPEAEVMDLLARLITLGVLG